MNGKTFYDIQMLSRGELPLIFMSADSTGAPFVNEGAPIQAVALSDGTVLAGVSTAAFKDGPHPNAAKVFLNWFISPEGQAVYSKAARVASVRKDVPNLLPQAAQVLPPQANHSDCCRHAASYQTIQRPLGEQHMGKVGQLQDSPIPISYLTDSPPQMLLPTSRDSA